MIKNITYIIKTIALLAIVFGCSNNSETSKEEEKLELDSLKTEIEQIVATGICYENSDCTYIAFGSKPCGGPRGYLVYNTSINVDLLREKVAIYNQNEATFNIKWGIISDCKAETPPTSIECINGDCVAIY